jgi:hypothetical protein
MTHGATHGPEFMTSLVSCVDAILKQGKLSVHEAVAQVAKEHNAKLNTVRRAYSRAQVSKERAHGNQLLSDNQEYSLCGIILAFASAGISIPRQDLIKIIRRARRHVGNEFFEPSLPMDWRSVYAGVGCRKEERRWYGSNIRVYRGVQALVGEIFVPD